MAAAAQAARNAAEGRTATDPPAWTEYTLYFLFARHAQLYDKYHQEGTILQWRSVWDLAAFEKWEPCRDTFEWDLGYMSLVQSRMKLDPDVIWQKMQPCLHQLSSDQALPSLTDLPSPIQQQQQPAARLTQQAEDGLQQVAEPADTWYLPHANQTAAAHADQPQHAMEVAVLSPQQEQQLQQLTEPPVVLDAPPAAIPATDEHEHPHVKDAELEAAAMYQQQLENLAEPHVEPIPPGDQHASPHNQQHHQDVGHMPARVAAQHAGSATGESQSTEEVEAAHISPERAASRDRLRSSLGALVNAVAAQGGHQDSGRLEDTGTPAVLGAVAPPGVLGEDSVSHAAGGAQEESNLQLPAIDPSGHHRHVSTKHAEDRSQHSRQYPIVQLDEGALNKGGGAEADRHGMQSRQYPAVEIVGGAAEAIGNAESPAHRQSRHHASLDPGRHLSHSNPAHTAQAAGSIGGVEAEIPKGKRHSRKLASAQGSAGHLNTDTPRCSAAGAGELKCT